MIPLCLYSFVYIPTSIVMNFKIKKEDPLPKDKKICTIVVISRYLLSEVEYKVYKENIKYKAFA